MANLAELLMKGDIGLYTTNGRLDLKQVSDNFGEHYHNLINHIHDNTDDNLMLLSENMKNILSVKENLYQLVDFVARVWMKKPGKIEINIEIDVDKMKKYNPNFENDFYKKLYKRVGVLLNFEHGDYQMSKEDIRWLKKHFILR